MEQCCWAKLRLVLVYNHSLICNFLEHIPCHSTVKQRLTLRIIEHESFGLR